MEKINKQPYIGMNKWPHMYRVLGNVEDKINEIIDNIGVDDVDISELTTVVNQLEIDMAGVNATQVLVPTASNYPVVSANWISLRNVITGRAIKLPQAIANFPIVIHNTSTNNYAYVIPFTGEYFVLGNTSFSADAPYVINPLETIIIQKFGTVPAWTVNRITGIPYYEASNAGNQLVLNSSAIVEWKAVPKVYRAFISQAGTDNPVATVIENTLGAAIVWTYNTTGSYFGTLIGAFTANKTFIPQYNLLGYPKGAILMSRGSADLINLNTFSDKGDTPSNSMLVNNPIEIIVYP